MELINETPTTFDVKAILFRKNEKGKSSHKSINVDSFRELLNSEEYRNKLHDGKLLGLLTHAGRKTAREGNIPHSDTVAIDPNFCNILRAVDEDEECVYGYFDLADTPAAERLKNLIKMGVKIGVSISTELIESASEFFIKKFHGVDFTLYPEFSSPVVQVNFSEADDNGITTITNEDARLQIGEFSLNEYIKEQAMAPYMILRNRVEEVVRFAKFHTNRRISNEKWILKSYIGTYIKSYVNKAIYNDEDINLTMTLRLDAYCSDRKSLRELQVALKRAKAQLSQSGYMTSDIQKSIDKAYTLVMRSVYDYINTKANLKEAKAL